MVKDSICSKQLIGSDELTTLDALILKTDCADNTVTIDGATIITPDIVARNGIIHVIDMLLLPPRGECWFVI